MASAVSMAPDSARTSLGMRASARPGDCGPITRIWRTNPRNGRRGTACRLLFSRRASEPWGKPDGADETWQSKCMVLHWLSGVSQPSPSPSPRLDWQAGAHPYSRRACQCGPFPGSLRPPRGPERPCPQGSATLRSLRSDETLLEEQRVQARNALPSSAGARQPAPSRPPTRISDPRPLLHEGTAGKSCQRPRMCPPRKPPGSTASAPEASRGRPPEAPPQAAGK